MHHGEGTQREGRCGQLSEKALHGHWSDLLAENVTDNEAEGEKMKAENHRSFGSFQDEILRSAVLLYLFENERQFRTPEDMKT